MSKISKDGAHDVVEVPGYEGRSQDLGGYTVAWETFSVDQDLTPLFKGLPDDHCQCPHWGMVLKGQITYRYLDGTSETMSAGEAYYARPGHLPVLAEGTETIEFSPTDGLGETMAVIVKNLAAMGVEVPV